MPQTLPTNDALLVVGMIRAAYARSISAALSQVVAQPSIAMQPGSAIVMEVREGGRIFRFNEPLYVNRFAKNGFIYLQNRSLSILSFGSSELDAVASFREDFAALWDCIAEAPDYTNAGSHKSEAAVSVTCKQRSRGVMIRCRERLVTLRGRCFKRDFKNTQNTTIFTFSTTAGKNPRSIPR